MESPMSLDMLIVLACQPRSSVLTLQNKKAAVTTVEIVRKCVGDWAIMLAKFMKYAWQNIERLQRLSCLVGRASSSATEAGEAASSQKCCSPIWNIVFAFQVLEVCSYPPKMTLVDCQGISGSCGQTSRIVTRCGLLPRHNMVLWGWSRARATLAVKMRCQLEPAWQKEDIKFEVVVKQRYVLSPLPLDVDRSMLQRIIDQIHWLSVSIRQMRPASWSAGSCQDPAEETLSFQDQLVLVSSEHSHHQGAVKFNEIMRWGRFFLPLMSFRSQLRHPDSGGWGKHAELLGMSGHTSSWSTSTLRLSSP